MTWVQGYYVIMLLFAIVLLLVNVMVSLWRIADGTDVLRLAVEAQNTRDLLLKPDGREGADIPLRPGSERETLRATSRIPS